ncbi:hypothetical protein [Lysobacter silvisoli]|uniref:hypothetical protein n=1 Tax=Lysobacter silvisoli TaxID=2293254 RepID=UPI0011C04F00|nr:hypothetical protein [Lysobacter silvisoli]
MNRNIVRVLSTTALLIAACAHAGNDRDDLKNRYKRARTEDERLQICIDAINKKVICAGCGIESVDAVFGTDFAKLDTSTEGADGYLHEIIPFNSGTIESLSGASENADTNDAPSSIGIRGWFLAVRFTRSGRIVSYSLTNVSKPF